MPHGLIFLSDKVLHGTIFCTLYKSLNRFYGLMNKKRIYYMINLLTSKCWISVSCWKTLSDAIFAEYDHGCKEYRMDVIWHHLNQIKSPIGHNFSFDFLFRVASIVLVIPHSVLQVPFW